jgi:hypothetical protein
MRTSAATTASNTDPFGLSIISRETTYNPNPSELKKIS